jgi:hypothetical protein
MLELVGKTLVLSPSVPTLGPSPSFGPSLEFPGSTFSSSALSLFGISFGLCWLCSWGVSSFDSSYKHKRKVNLKQWRIRRENKVRKGNEIYLFIFDLRVGKGIISLLSIGGILHKNCAILLHIILLPLICGILVFDQWF